MQVVLRDNVNRLALSSSNKLPNYFNALNNVFIEAIINLILFFIKA